MLFFSLRIFRGCLKSIQFIIMLCIVYFIPMNITSPGVSNRRMSPTDHIKSRHNFFAFSLYSAGLKCPILMFTGLRKVTIRKENGYICS